RPGAAAPRVPADPAHVAGAGTCPRGHRLPGRGPGRPGLPPPRPARSPPAPERFHLVGHDWGGQVAWVVADRHPDRLASLTILSRPHPGAFRRALSDDTGDRPH